MNTFEKNRAKEDYLRELGFEVIGTINIPGEPTEIQFIGDNDSTIMADDFEVGDTIGDILSVSEFYSCCGDILDKDLMICPSCKEHC